MNELNGESADMIVLNSIHKNIKYFEEYLEDNTQFLIRAIWKRKFCPVYSYDPNIEDKKLRKTLKHFIKVYNYYAPLDYTSDYKL